MRQNLSLETELGYSFAVLTRLFRCCRRCEFDIVDAKLVQRLGNFDLGLGIEECVRKLFALSQRRLNDLEVGDVAQEVLDGGVRV